MSTRKTVISVALIAEAQRFRQGLKDGQGAAASFEASLQNLGKVAAAALAFKAVKAVKDFVGDSVRAFSDLEQSIGVVEQVFGANATTILQWANTGAKAFGLSKSAANQAAAEMGSTFLNLGIDIDTATKSTTELLGRSGDLAAAFNTEVPQAVAALQSAIVGQYRPMRGFGVTLSEAMVEAKALEMGLGGVDRALTEQEKVLARVNIVMDQTNTIAGQFSRESESVAGKQAIFNAELENSKAVLGAALAPAKNLFTGLQTWGVRAMSDLFASINKTTGAWTAAEHASYQFQKSLQNGLSPQDAYAAGLEEVAENLEKVTRESDRNRRGHKDLDQAISEGAAQRRQYLKDLYNTVGGSEAAGKALRELWVAGKLTREEFDSGVATLAEFDHNAGMAAYQAWKLHDAEKAMASVTSTATEALDAQGVSLEEIAKHGQTVVDTLNQVAKAMEGPIAKTQELAEAEERYNQAVAQFGADSQEAIDASMAMLGAQAQVAGEWAEFFGGFGVDWEKAYRQLIDSGVAPDTAKAMIKQFQAAFNAAPLRVKVAFSQVKYAPDQHGTLNPVGTGQVKVFAQGGVAKARPGGVAGIFGEAGSDEAVIPLNSQGIGVLAEAMRRAGGLGGGIRVVVHAGMGADGDEIGTRIVEILQDWARRNGGIPGITRPA